MDSKVRRLDVLSQYRIGLTPGTLEHGRHAMLVALPLHGTSCPRVRRQSGDDIGYRVSSKNSGDAEKSIGNEREWNIDNGRARDADDHTGHGPAHPIECGIHYHDHAVRAVADWRYQQEFRCNAGHHGIVTEQGRQERARCSQQQRDDEA